MKKYPKVSKLCQGFPVILQAMEDRNGKYLKDPFTNSVVEFSPWVPPGPKSSCTQKGIFGIAFNLNPTDSYDDVWTNMKLVLFVRLSILCQLPTN